MILHSDTCYIHYTNIQYDIYCVHVYIMYIRTAVDVILDAPTCLYSSVCFRCRLLCSRELHGDNALKYGRRGGTAAAELRELARAVQSGSARLERHHATRYAIRQAQRASYTAGDSHPYVRATGHRNTRRARWTQLTTAFADTVPYVQTPS